MKSQRIFVVIPAYNEEKRLPEVILKLKQNFDLRNVIVVDDGSKIPLKLKTPILIQIRHDRNRGKGAAMRTGADYAFSHGASAVIFMDADGQHDPAEINKFVRYLNCGYDVVFGSRMMPINTPLMRFIGNKVASFYMVMLFGIYLSDILSGFRGLSKKAYSEIKWLSDDYSVETEMIARLSKDKASLKYTEFPILGIYFDRNKGMSLIDAFKVGINSLLWKIRLLK